MEYNNNETFYKKIYVTGKQLSVQFFFLLPFLASLPHFISFILFSFHLLVSLLLPAQLMFFLSAFIPFFSGNGRKLVNVFLQFFDISLVEWLQAVNPARMELVCSVALADGVLEAKFQ